MAVAAPVADGGRLPFGVRRGRCRWVTRRGGAAGRVAAVYRQLGSRLRWVWCSALGRPVSPRADPGLAAVRRCRSTVAALPSTPAGCGRLSGRRGRRCAGTVGVGALRRDDAVVRTVPWVPRPGFSGRASTPVTVGLLTTHGAAVSSVRATGPDGRYPAGAAVRAAGRRVTVVADGCWWAISPVGRRLELRSRLPGAVVSRAGSLRRRRLVLPPCLPGCQRAAAFYRTSAGPRLHARPSRRASRRAYAVRHSHVTRTSRACGRPPCPTSLPRAAACVALLSCALGSLPCPNTTSTRPSTTTNANPSTPTSPSCSPPCDLPPDGRR